jgi:hypothetical protein
MVRKRRFRLADLKMSAGKGIHGRELANDVEPDGIAEGVEHRREFQFIPSRFLW